MNKDTVKGKVKDAAGRAERQVGEWTDDEELQARGAGRQVEGKVQKGLGKAKDVVQEIREGMRDKKRDLEHDREVEQQREAEPRSRPKRRGAA